MCTDTIFLQSNVKYVDIVILSWPDLSIRHVTRQYMVGEGSDTSGHYEFINNTLVAIFKHSGRLYLLYGNSLMLLDDVHTQLEKDRNVIYLHVTTNENKFTIQQKFTDIRNDPTPMIDVEDFNFLIYLHNMINSKSRQELMLHNP